MKLRFLTVAGVHGSLRRCLNAVVAILLMLCSVAASADESVGRAELPKLAEMPLPTAEALLRADLDDKEFDWVVLKAGTPEDRRVVVVNPLDSRPDILGKQDQEYKKLEASRPQNQKEREARLKRLKSLKKLMFTLPGDLTEYAVPVEQVDQILYFEDLMLLVVDQLLEKADYRTSYELLLRVETELPGWEKSVPRFERLLLSEAATRAAAGEIYAALALLDQVFQRNPQSTELPGRLGELVRPMIADAAGKQDYRKARYLIDRVRRLFPQHDVAVAAQTELQTLSQDLLNKAAASSQQKQHADAAALARRAEDVWPTTGNGRASFTQMFARHQVLRVGINDPQGPFIHPAPLETDERLQELAQVSLFEPSSADELTYFRSGFFEVWDPTDLGREVVFTLRETKPSWQTQPLLTANQVAESIAHRIDAANPLYSSRLASFVSEISVRSPSQLRLRFSRVPLSIESLLRFPATRSIVPGSDKQNSPAGTGTTAVIATRFQKQQTSGNSTSWLRGAPEPDGLDAGKYHVAEIQEQRFDDRNRMIQAFNRGDLDYIPRLLPWEVDAFLASDFQVKKYSLPMTHVLIFNPRSERITNAQTRRALSFAINREGILRSTILRDESMKHGRPTSAAWNLRSYATEPREPAPRFNLRLAYALRFAAEQQLRIAELMKLTDAAREKARQDKINFDPAQFRKNTRVDYVKLPRLRFVVEPGEIPKAAAERMMTYWGKIGFEIDLIQGDKPGQPLADADWDFCYRQVRMEEPLLELWPVLANDSTFDMSRLGLYPDWMRQELVGLDYASSFLDAQEKLFTIHRHIAAQAFLIPLWEVDEYAVMRKNVTGAPNQLMSVYHNAERWMIKP